jgi:hypothetical protein
MYFTTTGHSSLLLSFLGEDEIVSSSVKDAEIGCQAAQVVRCLTLLDWIRNLFRLLAGSLRGHQQVTQHQANDTRHYG